MFKARATGRRRGGYRKHDEQDSVLHGVYPDRGIGHTSPREQSWGSQNYTIVIWLFSWATAAEPGLRPTRIELGHSILQSADGVDRSLVVVPQRLMRAPEGELIPRDFVPREQPDFEAFLVDAQVAADDARAVNDDDQRSSRV